MTTKAEAKKAQLIDTIASTLEQRLPAPVAAMAVTYIPHTYYHT